MAKNIELEQLVINKLTQEQFDNIEEKNPAELYFVTDAENDDGKGAQVEEMPEATEMNAGQIVQYVGETIPDVEATATITQTVGNSLTDLKVDAKKFDKASGLTEAGSLEFYTTGSKKKLVADELPTDANQGLIVKIDSDKFFDWLSHYEHIVDVNRISRVVVACIVNDDSSISDWGIEVYSDNNTLSTSLLSYSPELPEESGISYEVAWLDNFNTWCRAYFDIAPKNAEWFVNNQVIDVNQYGITYSGTPSNGDTLKVDCTPFVGGYEKGYFYVNQAQLSEPTATIEQTVGDSLSNLSVDVDKFMEAEQPVGDCDVEFTVAKIENTHTTYVTQRGDVSFSGDISKLLKAKGFEYELENGGVIVCGTHTDSVDDFYIGPRLGLSYIKISIDELREYGIRFDGTYFIDSHATWTYDETTDVFVASWAQGTNSTVDLKQYGVIYSGEPSEGDTLVVKYAEPAIVDHVWNQINVQPASKSSGGIEWVTKVDLPGDYVGNEYYAAPYYTIEGGLPDGTYEFYFSVKTTVESDFPLGEVIFKVLFTIDNKNMQANGRMGYVFDGSYMNDGNNIFSPGGTNFWSFFRKSDSDIVLYCAERPWASAVLAYNGHQTVPECFKLSAIKNINTGDTYIATGGININGFEPEYQHNYNGYLSLHGISRPSPEPPTHFLQSSANINSDSQYLLFAFTGAAINNRPDCSEFAICCASSSGGRYSVEVKNGIDSYIATVKEASGDLKNAQIGWCNSDHRTAIFFNVPDGFSDIVTVSLGMKGSNSANAGFWMETPSNFTPLVITKVGGTINVANCGMILQHTGDSDDNYTSGYFYKSSGTPIKNPASMEVTWQSVDGVEILIDAEKLAQAICSYVGWDTSYVKNELLRNNYNYVYYENEGSPYVYISFYGDFHDSSIVECFTINGELPDKYIEFNAGNYMDSTIEVVDGKWEQVNVQPASNTVQVTEMPEASEENVGKILQYIGTPTSEYDQGYFYKCTADGWVQVNVQPSSGGGGEAPSELPNLTGNEGRFLSNNGSELEWADVPTSLPAQEGHSGKFLTTDGTNLSWAEVSGGTSGFTKEEADELYVSKDGSGAAMFDMITRTQGQITVPDKTGTLALIEDIESIMGDLSSALDAINGEEI